VAAQGPIDPGPASPFPTSSTAGNVKLVTLNGRAVSLNASTTLVNTVINVPAP
jgi:hypothetical protein